MGLRAGTSSELSGSMAEAIEQAMETEYAAVKGEPLPTAGAADRRLLFAAIAQGVVRHLQENPDAFRVDVDLTTGDGAVDDVQTEGTLYS